MNSIDIVAGAMLISWSIVMFVALVYFGGIININKIQEGYFEALATLLIGIIIISKLWK